MPTGQGSGTLSKVRSRRQHDGGGWPGLSPITHKAIKVLELHVCVSNTQENVHFKLHSTPNSHAETF